jgi:hypothetical protein
VALVLYAVVDEQKNRRRIVEQGLN